MPNLTPRQKVNLALQDVAHVALRAAQRELEAAAGVQALADERLAIRLTRDLSGRWCVTARVVSDWGPGDENK